MDPYYWSLGLKENVGSTDLHHSLSQLSIKAQQSVLKKAVLKVRGAGREFEPVIAGAARTNVELISPLYRVMSVLIS